LAKQGASRIREAAGLPAFGSVGITPTFRTLANSWQQRPLVLKAGIQIALVAQSGDVSGFDYRN
jgi:hypothetical protein